MRREGREGSVGADRASNSTAGKLHPRGGLLHINEQFLEQKNAATARPLVLFSYQFQSNCTSVSRYRLTADSLKQGTTETDYRAEHSEHSEHSERPGASGA